MERNREARRVAMAAAGNGFSRRRHRAGSLIDSPEEESPVELTEAARVRDRGGGSTKKEQEREKERERERDHRLNSRSKRRRGERLIMMHGDLDEDDDTSDESVNDDEEYYDGGVGGVGPPSSMKMLPPASNISTNHQSKSFHPSKDFRSSLSPPMTSPVVSSSWKPADEMIGVSVPRKARSACTKRSHEAWTVFASGEQIHRRTSPASMLASPSPPLAPSSPPSSNVLVKKKITPGPKQKPLPPKSPVMAAAAQNEIEIEIAEVLYGMMRQPSREEKPSLEKKNIEINLMTPSITRSSPERDGDDIECVTAIEAKSKVTVMESEEEAKLLLVERKEDNLIVKPEDRNLRSEAEAKPQKLKRNCQLQHDLEKSGSNKAAQASPLSIPGWPGGLPAMGYLGPTQGVMPTDDSSLPSTTMQPPHLFFNQPRPKRCATHCYIARNIHYHQQFTKMNPFWPAAAGGSAPLYGSKACNLSLMPPAGSNSVPDQSSQSTPNSLDTTAQRKQILLHQTLPPGAGNNILHGPTIIFPLGQQPHAAGAIAAASVGPPNTGNTVVSSGAMTASASSILNGSVSAAPGGATAMSFSYPNMPTNETQYLAILQNNGYAFPHVGAPPAYRGVNGQPMPFFNGQFYSSQVVHTPHLQPQQQSGQGQQSHAPSNQNTNVSTDSSAAQKHLQNQQRRPPAKSQGFSTQKVKSQPLSFQQRQHPRENATQHTETAGEYSPSTADSRAARSNVAYGQNFAMPMHPTNMGLMGSAASSGGVVGYEKKQEQQGSKVGAESIQSQPYAMTFAAFNGGMNMPSIAQSHSILHGVPETTRQGYNQMMAAIQKINYTAPEDGLSGSNAAVNATVQRKTTGANAKTTTAGVGQYVAFSGKQASADASASAATGDCIIDSSARLLNLGSAQPWSSNSAPISHQHMQRNQPHQQYSNYTQMQQQYAVAAARGKEPVISNGSVFSDHNIASMGTNAPNATSGFSQNLVQSGGGNPVQSPQWKNNSPTASTMAQSKSTSMPSPSASSSLKNAQQKQKGRPQQSQVSFAANSKTLPCNSPMQQGAFGGANQTLSPSTSSVSKNAGGSPRTTPSISMSNKAGHGQVSSTTLSSSQPSKNPQPASSSGGRNNGQSILGNHQITTTTSNPTSKSQQQHHLHLQQAQLFFPSPYMQPQHHQQRQINIAPASGYYIQRHQPESGSSAAATSVTLSSCTTATSDPAKAINMKGGGNNNNNNNLQNTQTARKIHHQQKLVPPGFSYVHAVQVKPGDQKQQAGE